MARWHGIIHPVAGPKTVATEESPAEFIGRLEDEPQRADSLELVDLLESVCGEPATMWGASIVGFGTRNVDYASGQSATWMLVGFSPRAREMSLYGFTDFDGSEEVLSRLGRHRQGKSCLYIRRLDDIDRGVLREIADRAVQDWRGKSGT